MEDLVSRFIENLGGRWDGPMWFRLLLQPTVATVLGIRAGIQDARNGRPVYLWTIFTDPDSRRDLIASGWKDVAKVFVLAAVLDLLYQAVVLHWIHPGETLLVAFLLACTPYLLIRGPVNRITARPGPARPS